MGHIPQQLISSFMELGLLESEAKIYSALVLFHDAEVKELQEFLDLSRPSIYEGLRALEDKGYIVLTNPKPTTYQAIPPDIVLDMMTAAHLKAKDEVLTQIRKLEKEKFADDSPPNLWYIFGPKSFESKIKDMLENARESIVGLVSEKYLDYFEIKTKGDIKYNLTIISESSKAQKWLEHVLKKDEPCIRTIDKSHAIALMAPFKAGYREDKIPAMGEVLNLFDFDNVLILIVDDAEVIYIPPIPDESLNAMMSKNKAFIKMMTLLMPILVPND